MSVLWNILGGVALTYVCLTALVYVFQRFMQYFPDRSPARLPTARRYTGLEEVELVTSDGCKLCCWHWPGTRPLTVVLFHGNGGHRGDRQAWMAEFHDLGCGVFFLEYRGYGGSQGSPTEKGFYLDADAAVSWLNEKDVGELVFIGESIGGGVAVEMAVRHSPAALILQSGFPSAVAVARRAYPIFPVRLLMKDRYDSASKIDAIRCPLLMIHGASDSIVPASLGRTLFEMAPEPKQWLEIPGADHNDPMWVDPSYTETIRTFLKL